MTTLNLTQAEQDLISKVAKDRKFKFGIDELYENSYKKRLECYIKAYRFIQNIYIHIKSQEDIVTAETKNSIDSMKIIENKLNNFLISNKNIYIEAEKLFNSILKNIHFSNSIREQRIVNFVIENLIQINETLDEVFSLGRIVKLYDASDAAGVY